LGITLDDTISILQYGKPLKTTAVIISSGSDSNPVLINNDSGEILNCFFNIDEQYAEYDNLEIPRSKEETSLPE
jgi:hypothetical protein